MLIPGLLLAAACALNFDPAPRAFDAPTLHSAYRVLTADLDGDGRTEVIVSDRPSYIRWGDGEIEVLADTWGATPADVNGDGRIDLFVSTGNPARLGVRLNRGNDVFDPPVYVYDGNYGFIVTADFTNDGAPDAILVDREAQPAFLLNDGRGGFTVHFGSAPSLMSESWSQTAVVAGDFNGDGNLDLAASKPRLKVFLGNGAGHFTESATIAAAGAPLAAHDLDGDGKDEIIAKSGDSPNFDTLIVHADTGATEPLATAPHEALAAAVADFNRDGKPDIAIATLGSRVRLFIDGEVSVVKVPTPSDVFAANDFDRDGDIDLLVQSGLGTGILHNAGDGTFPRLPRIPAPDLYPTATQVADVDGDGIDELLMATHAYEYELVIVRNGVVAERLGKAQQFWFDERTGQLAAVREDGIEILVRGADGTWKRERKVAVNGLVFQVELADFTGDGINELLINVRDENLKMFARIVDVFAARTLFELPGSSYLAAADVNGDGRMDLAITFAGSWSGLPHDYDPRPDGFIDVHLNAGGMNFLPPQRVLSGRAFLPPRAGDFDGDGADELAVGTFDRALYVISNGIATELMPRNREIGGVTFIDVGDINDDGFDDIAAMALWGNLNVFMGSAAGLTHAGTFMPATDDSFPLIARLEAGKPRAILMREHLLNEKPQFVVLQPRCVALKRRGVRN